MKDRIEGGGHHMKVPREEYMNLYKQFNPLKWKPESLLEAATDAGMKYVVFVTKRYDGFTMWPTKEKRCDRSNTSADVFFGFILLVATMDWINSS